jgi:predicted neuraminidase
MSLQRARAARDRALRIVEENADERWKEQAIYVVEQLARHRPRLIADDVLRLVGYPREPRALGPVMMRAKKEGWIEPLDQWIQNPEPQAHARPVRLWASLIYEDH